MEDPAPTACAPDRRQPAREALTKGDLPGAEAAFAALLDVDAAWATNGLGLVAERRRKWADAEARFRDAVALAPDQLPYRLNRIKALRALARDEEAETQFAEVTARWGADPAVVSAAVSEDLRRHRPEEAWAKLEPALRAAPRNRNLLTHAVVAAERLGRLDDAIAMQTRIVGLDPKDPARRLRLLGLLQAAGRTADAAVVEAWFHRHAPTDAGYVAARRDRLTAAAAVLEARRTALETWAGLLPFLDPAVVGDPDLAAVTEGVTDVAAVWPEVMRRIVRNERLALRGGRFHYVRAEDLPVLLDEIFVCEDYRFESRKAEPFIIDCGANIGLAVHYQKLRFPRARILAFEPGRRAHAALLRNVAAMGWSDVEVLPHALGGSDGEASFFDPETMPMGGSVTDRLADRALPGTRYPVEVRRLSGHIDREVDFLKLDIEGVEAEVIGEIADKLPMVRALFCEIHHDRSGTKSNRTITTILDVLERCDFETLLTPAASGRHRAPRGLGRVGARNSMNLWARNRRF